MWCIEESKKKTISREICARDLRGLALLDLSLYAILFVVISAICIPLIFPLWRLLKPIPLLGGVLVILLITSSAVPAAFLIRSLLALRCAVKGEFSIVEDTVCRISRGEPGGRNRTVDALYFTRHGRYVSGGAHFELTNEGDPYYLVIRKGKQAPELAYSQKFYDCGEEDLFAD